MSFDWGMIYRRVSKSFEMSREQVESVEDETNVPVMGSIDTMKYR